MTEPCAHEFDAINQWQTICRKCGVDMETVTEHPQGAAAVSPLALYTAELAADRLLFGGTGVNDKYIQRRDAAALRAISRALSRSGGGDVGELAARIVRDVAELPDRTSPDDWPEAMLVTSEELHGIVTAALSSSSTVRDGVLEEAARVAFATAGGERAAERIRALKSSVAVEPDNG